MYYKSCSRRSRTDDDEVFAASATLDTVEIHLVNRSAKKVEIEGLVNGAGFCQLVNSILRHQNGANTLADESNDDTGDEEQRGADQQVLRSE